jgi:flagellar protein FlgJ
MNDVANSPQSYLDFAGLGNLRGQAQQKTEKATRDTATQFEAMFIQMMMKSMRDATEKSDLMGSETAENFEQMYDKELSVQMAKRNTVGVADMLVKQINSSNAATAAAQAAADKTNVEPQKALPLKPAETGLSLPQGQNAVPLVRPDRFTIKPANTVGALNAGADK